MLPKRKPNRLEYCTYSAAGSYFITICTQNRRPILWYRPLELSSKGKKVLSVINECSNVYPCICIDRYVIMSDHVHILIRIKGDAHQVTISQVVRMMKREASKRIGSSIWQKGFYDHIIRSSEEYWDTVDYIDGIPKSGCKDIDRTSYQRRKTRNDPIGSA